MLELVRHADALIENYRPDVMPRLGLGYDALREVNPHLVMLSISGFGRDGPESRRPAHRPIVHAQVGLMARSMRRGKVPNRDLPLSVADTNASLHGPVAPLAAVILRQRAGFGQHIDMAMIDATIATDDQLHYELEDSEDTMSLPNDTWETGVGPILVSADFRYLWQRLTTQLGVAEPTTKGMNKATRIARRRGTVARYMRSLAASRGSYVPHEHRLGTGPAWRVAARTANRSAPGLDRGHRRPCGTNPACHPIALSVFERNQWRQRAGGAPRRT